MNKRKKNKGNTTHCLLVRQAGVCCASYARELLRTTQRLSHERFARDAAPVAREFHVRRSACRTGDARGLSHLACAGFACDKRCVAREMRAACTHLTHMHLQHHTTNNRH